MLKNLKNLKNLEKAVSPVIGVILMVAITIVMAAIIGVFVFDIMPEEPAPIANINIIVEDNRTFRIEHLGGEAILNAFNSTDNDWDTRDWRNIEVRINGVMVGEDATGVADLDTITNEFNDAQIVPHRSYNLIQRDVMRFRLAGDPNFISGDTITVIHVPTGATLARHVVVI